MEFKLKRRIFGTDHTIGGFVLEECGPLCDCLEDKDRGLRQDMTKEEIERLKVAGETAIPTGRYEVIMALSPSMKDKEYAKPYGGLFPCLLGVPGFSGVLIHPGNTKKDTRGCLLPGDYDPKQPGRVSGSVQAYHDLMRYLWPAHKRKERIYITIE